MPRKPKKNIEEMTDRELLRSVFPEKAVQRVEEEIGLRNPVIKPVPDDQTPDTQSL